MFNLFGSTGIKWLTTLALILPMVSGVGCSVLIPAPPPSVIEITVTAKSATFEPSTITVAKGQTIKLTIISIDTFHTFTIDELGINVYVPDGQTITKEFTEGDKIKIP